MSTIPLRLLLIEDFEDDAALVLRELHRSGYAVSHIRVETPEALECALDAGPWEVVISDYALPRFDGLAAFAQVQRRGLDVPFLIVSGKIGEDVAVAAMKAGVHDFVLKDRLGRLGPAVARELREAEGRAERRKIQEHLMLSDRLASLGMLAASVAHEINNPLAALMLNLQLALPPPQTAALAGAAASEEAQALQDALQCAERIRDIIRDIKIFSRPDEHHTGTVELHRVFDSSLRMAQNQVQHRARLVKDYGEVPAVQGSEARLGQIFLNLVINAAQAIPEGHSSEHEIRVVTRREAADTVRVEIHDTGAGIALELRERIFEPFFTTKPVGMGTGLGLSICRRLVAEMGGCMGVESTPGKGSVFWIRLQAARQAEEVPVKRAPRPAQRLKVLIIDDEAAVARSLQRHLSRQCDVTVLTRAREALELIMAGQRFDAILCDVMMPELSGPQFHAQLVLVAPEQALRITFMTGGAFSEEARAFLDSARSSFVEKPLDLERLWTLLEGSPLLAG
jgi:signal transduction histidine kinase